MYLINNAKVVSGHGRGKKIGIPTINLDPTSTNQIEDGIYVCKTIFLIPYWAVCHIGSRPTFGEQERTVEIHLLDANPFPEIPKTISVEIYDKLRDVLQFNSTEEMIEQIHKDIISARNIIKKLL